MQNNNPEKRYMQINEPKTIVFLVGFYLMFPLRVTYKEDLKLLKYEEFKVVFCLEYKETYGIQAVKSFLKSHFSYEE